MRQIFVLINQTLILSFFILARFTGEQITTANAFHLALITLLTLAAAYVSYKNMKGNKVLKVFCGLIILSVWHFLLLLLEGNNIAQNVSIILEIVMFYQVVRFTLLFLFQDSAYLYQERVILLLSITCALTVAAKFINDRLFALLFLLQAVVAFICVIWLMFAHRKRVAFVLRSHKKQIALTITAVLLPFTLYCLTFHNRPDYLENIGNYLIVTLPCAVILAIFFWERTSGTEYFRLSRHNKTFLTIGSAIVLAVTGYISDFAVITYALIIHGVLLIGQLYYLLVYVQLEKRTETENLDGSRHFYAHSLSQIKREEALKMDVSNFLHDEVLQDLLSIKNMMRKTERPEVKELIISTLEKLNTVIRNQMQEYHPALLKNLTLKENIKSLLDSVKTSFPNLDMQAMLDCDDRVFLVEPYNLIIYRIIKELATNAFKHSNGTRLHVILLQKNDSIELIVSDNGAGLKESELGEQHKGLASMYEQVSLLNGVIDIATNFPHGTRIAISMPMKGEGSYESFIG